MEKLQIRYTPEEADRVAAVIAAALDAGYETDQREELAAEVARLRNLAARARKRATRNPAA